jgi:hypothetical protein
MEREDLGRNIVLFFLLIFLNIYLLNLMWFMQFSFCSWWLPLYGSCMNPVVNRNCMYIDWILFHFSWIFYGVCESNMDLCASTVLKWIRMNLDETWNKHAWILYETINLLYKTMHLLIHFFLRCFMADLVLYKRLGR